MKRSISMSILTASLASICVVAFQNCSSGGLPDLQNQTSASTQPARVPVALIPDPYNASMAKSTTQQLSVTNAIGTVTFAVGAGTSCSVTPAGFVTAASPVPANAVCTVTATDSGGNLPAAIYITVTDPANDVTPGTQSFDMPGTTPFVVPAFKTLIVEVYGAGAGGSTYWWNGDGTPKGTDGQRSTVTINGVQLIANGGKAGEIGSLLTGGHASPGKGGTASGGTPSPGRDATLGFGGKAGGPNGGAGGNAADEASGAFNGISPGGGGSAPFSAGLPDHGVPASSSGGGGGGGYTTYTYIPSATTQNLNLSLTIGAGGVGGSLETDPTVKKPTGDGAPGRIVLTWR